jgi:predicted nucleic acid-binding Zn ribbon protein
MRTSSAVANAANERLERKRRRAALFLSLAVYAIFIGVNLDPEVTKAQVGVAGERPFGIPTRTFFMALNAILFFPVFWWTPSLMKLQAYAAREHRSFVSLLLSAVFTPFELFSLYTSVNATTPPEIRRARNIAFFGFLYFGVLVVIWIVLAARAGV